MLSNPLFWIGFYLVGYMITIAVISLPGLSTKVGTKFPKPLVRIFILLTFLAPPIVLPFTGGPRIAIPASLAVTIGLILLAINFIIKILGQRQIGVLPALKGKAKLVTAGIYGVIRHPLYLSNGLLALGMAVTFKSIYALLFSIPYSLSYLLIIHFEERDLLAKYGEEYRGYKRKVPWRIIPKVI